MAHVGPAGVPGRTVIIANPRAGGTDEGLVGRVESACRRHGGRVDVRWTRGHGHAAGLARKCLESPDSPDLIVSIGGDGTFSEVATGVVGAPALGRAVSLLVLPGGTGNSNYRSLWDDAPWHRAVEAAFTGSGAERRLLDLARVPDPERLVVLGASTGLFAAATAEARGLAIAGRSRYRAALASATASFVPYPGRVTVDGEVLHEGETLLVNVGGGRHRAGVLNVLPLSVRDDGLLDVCVVGAGAAPARVLESMRDGAHLGLPGVRYATGRRIVVERTDGRVLEWESDGEVGPADRSRLVLDVLPGLLPVIASADRPGG